MLRLLTILCTCLTALSAYCQSASKWQVGTITEVKIHQPEKARSSNDGSYDVSVTVGDTIYVVLYKPAFGEETVKYVVGRELLLFVDKTIIRYNDILGQAHEVPIESQRPVVKPSKPQAVSHVAR
jgi:hypothetical protein